MLQKVRTTGVRVSAGSTLLSCYSCMHTYSLSLPLSLLSLELVPASTVYCSVSSAHCLFLARVAVRSRTVRLAVFCVLQPSVPPYGYSSTPSGVSDGRAALYASVRMRKISAASPNQVITCKFITHKLTHIRKRWSAIIRLHVSEGERIDPRGLGTQLYSAASPNQVIKINAYKLTDVYSLHDTRCLMTLYFVRVCAVAPPRCADCYSLVPQLAASFGVRSSEERRACISNSTVRAESREI